MYGSGPRTRRTFLVGLGRFLAIAPLSALVKPPVLYSFPSTIKPLNIAAATPYIFADIVGQMYRIVFDIDNQVWLATGKVGTIHGDDDHGGVSGDQDDWEASREEAGRGGAADWEGLEIKGSPGG